jgi:hypothetical protein
VKQDFHARALSLEKKRTAKADTVNDQHQQEENLGGVFDKEMHRIGKLCSRARLRAS